jgi:hypothetical protein
MSEAKAVSAFALVVASLDIPAVLELTVAVNAVISEAKALVSRCSCCLLSGYSRQHYY